MAWLEVTIVEDPFEEQKVPNRTWFTGKGHLKFYCKSDTVIDRSDGFLVASAGGTSVSAMGAAWSVSRPFCTVRRRGIDRKSPRDAYVTCYFEEPTGAGGASSEANLLSQPIRVRRGPESFFEPYEKDAEDELVRNVVGDRFDSLPERQNGIGVLHCRKFVNAATRSAIEALWNTNNDATFTIDGISCAEDTLWLADMDFPPVEGAANVYDGSWTLKYKKDGWSDRVLNNGYRALFSSVLKSIMETGEDGKQRPIRLPWPLNLDGTKKTNQTDVPDELVFFPYEQTSWAGLPNT